MYTTQAWAKAAADSDFQKIDIQRNLCGEEDVTFAVKYCGVCHSDVHVAEDHLKPVRTTNYPCVPGHELAGLVTEVGAKVTAYKVGDMVGVGCISDSCLACPGCSTGNEHTCQAGMTGTYNGETKHGHIATDRGWTFGGYSKSQTVHQR